MTLECAALAFCDLTTVVKGDWDTGLIAVGAKIIKSEGFSYIPPDVVVTKKSGDEVTVGFGSVHNVNSATSSVVMEVSFTTSPTMLEDTLSLPSALKVGTNTIDLGTVEIKNNVNEALVVFKTY